MLIKQRSAFVFVLVAVFLADTRSDRPTDRSILVVILALLSGKVGSVLFPHTVVD